MGGRQGPLQGRRYPSTGGPSSKITGFKPDRRGAVQRFAGGTIHRIFAGKCGSAPHDEGRAPTQAQQFTARRSNPFRSLRKQPGFARGVKFVPRPPTLPMTPGGIVQPSSLRPAQCSVAPLMVALPPGRPYTGPVQVRREAANTPGLSRSRHAPFPGKRQGDGAEGTSPANTRQGTSTKHARKSWPTVALCPAGVRAGGPRAP